MINPPFGGFYVGLQCRENLLMAADQTSTSSRLSEEEVVKRLESCDSDDVLDELYVFGQSMMKDADSHIRIVETKSQSFAAYGLAVITLLVSTSSGWLHVGNQYDPAIALCAAICALICTYLSISALKARPYDCISEDEWLNADCLSKLTELKRYRILIMWGAVSSYGKIQDERSKKLVTAQTWIEGSGGYLVLLLFHIAYVRSGLGTVLWIAAGEGWRGIANSLRIPKWNPPYTESGGLLGWIACILILGTALGIIIRRVRAH